MVLPKTGLGDYGLTSLIIREILPEELMAIISVRVMDQQILKLMESFIPEPLNIAC